MPMRPLIGLLRCFFRLLYRVEVTGLEHYHLAGERALIVANHVSLLDGVLLYLFLPQPPIFAINTCTAQKWYLKPFLWPAELFIMDPTDALSVKSMVKLLRGDRKAVIFPEGRITITGSLMKVYDGPGLIAEKADAVILPIGIDGAQYTPFSCLGDVLRRRWFPKIRLTLLAPIRLNLPAGMSGHARRKIAARVMEEVMQRIAYVNTFRPLTLFDALLEVAATHGGGATVAEDSQRMPLTCRQLITRAFILGDAVARATRPGEHIGLLLPNSNGALTVFMALHCVGRVPAMLNFTAGVQGVITAAETASIRLVYTSRKFIEAGKLEELAAALQSRLRLVYLEDLRGRISVFAKLGGLIAARFARLAYHRRHRDRDPGNTAVILFTSGSEGIPKGVVLSHANILANCAQTSTLIGLNRRDIVFNALPVFHSFGLTGGTFLPLYSGAKIFFYPTPLHYRVIPELVYEIGATVLFGTNTFLAGYARHAHPYDFFRLRYVIAGAEKLQAQTRRLWSDQFGIRILEGYGTTEASPVVSVNTPMGNKPGTVGRLLTQMEYYLEPVEGIERGGRLVIRGPNIMKGYLYHGSDGEILPPSTRRGPGWYDSGDIVEVDEDGYIRIAGRAKRFAKVGGEMISLAAVEEAAAGLWPKGKHAALAVLDSRKGEKIVLVTEQKNAQRRQFLEYAQQHGLSELCVPRRIVTVEAVPLLGSGKIDYRCASDLLEREHPELS